MKEDFLYNKKRLLAHVSERETKSKGKRIEFNEKLRKRIKSVVEFVPVLSIVMFL